MLELLSTAKAERRNTRGENICKIKRPFLCDWYLKGRFASPPRSRVKKIGQNVFVAENEMRCQGTASRISSA